MYHDAILYGIVARDTCDTQAGRAEDGAAS